MTVRGKKCGDPGNLRSFVLIGAIVFPVGYSFGQTAFWNSKEPQRHSDGEKVQIMTNSPWVKVVHSKAPTSGISGTWGNFASSPGGDRDQGPPSRHSASLPTRAPAPKSDVKNPLAFYGPVTIRWETASPIRQLTDIALLDAFENHYVISVKGLPASVLRPDGSMLPGASLSARNRQPNAAEFVALTGDKLTLLLAFPVFDPPITALDKTIVFTMNLTGIEIDAK